MLNTSNQLAEDDRNYRLLREHTVEAERALYAIEEALKDEMNYLTTMNKALSILQ